MNNEENIIREDSLFIEGIRLLYPRLQNDIEIGKSPEKNLRSIESCMNEIAGFISQSRILGNSVGILEDVYEELGAMKEQILKKSYPHPSNAMRFV